MLEDRPYRFARCDGSWELIKSFLAGNDIPPRDTPLDTVIEFAEDSLTLDQFVRVNGERIVQGETFARHRVTFPLRFRPLDVPLAADVR